MEEVDIVGPVEVRFETRATSVRALVIPDTEEVLLGAISLEGLDVIIDPLRERFWSTRQKLQTRRLSKSV